MLCEFLHSSRSPAIFVSIFMESHKNRYHSCGIPVESPGSIHVQLSNVCVFCDVWYFRGFSDEVRRVRCRISVRGTRTVQLTEWIVIAASSVACRSALLSACPEMVLRHLHADDSDIINSQKCVQVWPLSASTLTANRYIPLVGRQEVHPACRRLDVGLLVVWHFDWSFARHSSSYHHSPPPSFLAQTKSRKETFWHSRAFSNAKFS